jgi:hypothetical protein
MENHRCSYITIFYIHKRKHRAEGAPARIAARAGRSIRSAVHGTGKIAASAHRDWRERLQECVALA